MGGGGVSIVDGGGVGVGNLKGGGGQVCPAVGGEEIGWRLGR